MPHYIPAKPDRLAQFEEPSNDINPTLARLKGDIARARLACEVVRYVTDQEASLLGPTRGSPEQATARQMAMYLTHVGFGMSLQRTAGAFGRDRSTIAHACHKMEDARDIDSIDLLLEQLEQALGALPPPNGSIISKLEAGLQWDQAA
jgi:Bacterial dnaA protein helix-turn-helix